MISHREINEIMGCRVRNDTYQILKRIVDYGEDYVEAKKYIIDHQKELEINETLIKENNLVTLKRIKQIIKKCNLENSIVKKEEKQKKKDNIKNEYGIYGIYIDNKLVYIGMTSRSFKSRFSDYKSQIQNPTRKIEYMMVNAKANNKEVEMRPLISNKEFFTLSETELKKIEYSLIKVLQPEGNIEGTILPYDRSGKLIREMK